MCSDSSSTARTFRYEDIALGAKEARDYVISQEVYDHFLSAFGDRSPIHVDEDYARACGFEGRVMHGALLNGFLSHYIGMYFPGRLSLLLAVDLRLAKPSYLGDTIHLEAVVSQKLDASNVVVLDAVFTNVTRDCLVARSRVQVMVRNES
ncbi:MAG: MaoC/PaaZ C-terminal domain-containing protein [Chthoniobacter sp.]|uniref:MaoC/PaaZ C-terminal domain-containing protein n=1 Tax=Chthoniobacter sp. TaxID=2510640 RepID=UPI0032A1EBA2